MVVASQRNLLLSSFLLKYFFYCCDGGRIVNVSITEPTNSTLYDIKLQLIKNSLLIKTGLDKPGIVHNTINKLPDVIIQEFWKESKEYIDYERAESSKEVRKIIVRAKRVTFANCTNCIKFWRQSSSQGTSVVKADVWIHHEPSIDVGKRTFVKVHIIDRMTWKRTLLGRNHIRHKTSGWHAINLKGISKYTTNHQGFLYIDLILQVTCNRCKVNLAGEHLPYFELSEESIIKVEIPKDVVKCTRTSTSCCLDDFRVDFKDYIGKAGNIIVLPKEINVGFCRGVCNIHSSLDIHSSILRSSQMRDSNVEDLCCVPRKYKSFSTLVYNNEGEIAVRDIHDIIVGGCGCA